MLDRLNLASKCAKTSRPITFTTTASASAQARAFRMRLPSTVCRVHSVCSMPPTKLSKLWSSRLFASLISEITLSVFNLNMYISCENLTGKVSS